MCSNWLSWFESYVILESLFFFFLSSNVHYSLKPQWTCIIKLLWSHKIWYFLILTHLLIRDKTKNVHFLKIYQNPLNCCFWNIIQKWPKCVICIYTFPLNLKTTFDHQTCVIIFQTSLQPLICVCNVHLFTIGVEIFSHDSSQLIVLYICQMSYIESELKW